MDLMYERCAGLDVHAKTVVACARIVSGGTVAYTYLTVVPTTRGLRQLGDWLVAQGVTHAALEATGVYWKPVWHILADYVALTLAHPQHIRHVPGRKSDKTDATWIADLLAVGLIRGSFVPPAPVQALRDLTRTRKQLVRELARHTQRVQKILEDANLKLTEAISDIRGASGRAILRALVAGETDPERLADVTQGRLKASRAHLVEVLQGRVTAHHRYMLRLHLQQIDALEHAVGELDAHIEHTLGPFRAAIDLLTTMPGLSTIAATVLVAEIGADMTVFPTAGHLVSWVGLCPRLDESAGKRRSTRTRPSARWLKPVLVQAAWAATRQKNTYFHAQFMRLKARRGPKKAILAVAASMLTSAYHMLRTGSEFVDLGPQHFTRQDTARLTRRLVRRLHDLGVEVEIKQPAA